MEKKNRKEPSAENPYKLSDLKLTKVEKWAAGVPAVMAALEYSCHDLTLTLSALR